MTCCCCCGGGGGGGGGGGPRSPHCAHSGRTGTGTASTGPSMIVSLLQLSRIDLASPRALDAVVISRHSLHGLLLRKGSTNTSAAAAAALPVLMLVRLLRLLPPGGGRRCRHPRRVSFSTAAAPRGHGGEAKVGENRRYGNATLNTPTYRYKMCHVPRSESSRSTIDHTRARRPVNQSSSSQARKASSFFLES